MLLRDRTEAGQKLADRLTGYRTGTGLLVLALPRGGVPVASEIAASLRAPLDVRYVRKIGAPGQPEFAIGAIASGGIELLNAASVRALGLTREQVQDLRAQARQELAEREQAVRRQFPLLPAADMHVIVVDDGLATGSTMRVAVQALRREGARHITVAVPVGAASVLAPLGALADEVVSLHAPIDFDAVSRWYRDFDQVTDEEVLEILAGARAHAPQ